MRILQLCLKPPLPARDGGCIAMNNVTRGLLALGHEVKILTIVTHKHGFDPVAMGELYMEQTQIEGVFVDTKVNLVDAFSSMVTQDSYNVNRFFSTDFDLALTRILNKTKFDIIHLESLFMTPYIGTIRRRSKAKIVLRSHNLEHVIWERMASGTRNPAKRAYVKYLSKKLKEYELSVMHDVDGIAAISHSDEKRFRELDCPVPLKTIPFGIDLSTYRPEDLLNSPPTVFHIGAMDWTPNVEGLLWFLDEVWPLVLQENGDIQLMLAGRGLNDDLLPSGVKNVKLIGEVADAKAFMRNNDIMIVPLLTAGGIRVKTIEGMALQKAIVTTTIGLEGIDAVGGTHLEIADEPEDFARAILKLASHTNQLTEMGKEARKLAEKNFDNIKIIEQLVDFYTELKG